MGINEDVSETIGKDNANVAKDESTKAAKKGEGGENADGSAESVTADADDVSDLETPVQILSEVHPHHSAGNQIRKKKATGLRSEAKTLYEGPPKCTCCVNWVEKIPSDARAALQGSAEHGNYALLLRRTAHGPDQAWNIQSMMIYSPFILAMLRTALKGYPGLALALDQLAIESPFAPLLHRWSLIDEALKEEDDAKARNHYNLFRQVVEPELEPHLKARDECEEHAVIPFASIWTIFKPGDFVWWEADGQGVVGRTAEANFGKNSAGQEIFNIACEQVDWNGEKFGIQKSYQEIDSFEGTRPVIGLPVMPLRFKPNAHEIRDNYLTRGRKFESLRGYHFRAYDGPALGSAPGPLNLQRVTKKFVSELIV